MPERCPICDQEECGHSANEKLIRKQANQIAMLESAIEGWRRVKQRMYGPTTPLTIEAIDGVLQITIGVEMLALAAVGSSAWPSIRITDPDLFAKDVAKHIANDEAEDGSTPLHRIFDAATEAMIEDCCLGLEYDEKIASQGPPESGWRDPVDEQREKIAALEAGKTEPLADDDPRRGVGSERSA